MLRIFISYRVSDSKSEARDIYDRLIPRYGKDNVFLDELEIQPGEHWLAKIKSGLLRTDVVLVLIGPDWLHAKGESDERRLDEKGDILVMEIKAALDSRAVTIPLMLNGAVPPSSIDLPESISPLTLWQAIRLKSSANDEDYDELFSYLDALPERIPDTVGEYFKVGDHVGATQMTDIYEAVPESHVREMDKVLLHLLKAGEEGSETRKWFENYCSMWEAMLHPNVAKIHEKSDCSAEARFPFYAVDADDSGISLEDEIRSANGLEEERIIDVLLIVCDIAKTAHERDIILQNFKPSEISEINGVLTYRGFEAAVRADENFECYMDFVKENVLSVDQLAPELAHSRFPAKLNFPALDVYAVGKLIRSMQKLPIGSARRILGAERQNIWECLVFHCLWEDPGGRFQNVGHFRRFLESYKEDKGALMETVPLVHGGKARISAYPVTNCQFERFCAEGKYARHIPDANSKSISARLQGPLCPAVNVSLDDALKYCDWLSKRTNELWRLPTEAEWIMAAAGLEGIDLSKDIKTRSANYGGLGGGPTVVGAFVKNKSTIGCRDMLGNVWEWCSDKPHDHAGLRLVKGGSFSSPKKALTTRSRKLVLRTCRSNDIGFRVLKEG